jgi:hypothetical protein
MSVLTDLWIAEITEQEIGMHSARRKAILVVCATGTRGVGTRDQRTANTNRKPLSPASTKQPSARGGSSAISKFRGEPAPKSNAASGARDMLLTVKPVDDACVRIAMELGRP